MFRYRDQAVRKGRDGRFGSDDFRYDAQDDTYVCPAGRAAGKRRLGTSIKDKLYFVYRGTAAVCRDCSLSKPMPGEVESRRAGYSAGSMRTWWTGIARR